MLDVILSVISVSIDGFFAGAALSFKNTKIKLKKIIIISIIPIIMAYPVTFFGYKLSIIINSNLIKIISFILFLILSINSFIEIRKNKRYFLLFNYFCDEKHCKLNYFPYLWRMNQQMKLIGGNYLWLTKEH